MDLRCDEVHESSDSEHWNGLREDLYDASCTRQTRLFFIA
jgi:hypothetical protein